MGQKNGTEDAVPLGAVITRGVPCWRHGGQYGLRDGETHSQRHAGPDPASSGNVCLASPDSLGRAMLLDAGSGPA